MSAVRYALICAAITLGAVMGLQGLRNYVAAHVCVSPAALVWCAR